MAEELDIDRRWPELFVPLNPKQHRDIMNVFAANWHEGWVPNRQDVADLIDQSRGLITTEEYTRRTIAKAKRIEAAQTREK